MGVRFSRFLCRDEDERDWLMDMNRRIARLNHCAVGVLVVFVLACLPWLDPLSLVPVALGGVAFGVAEAMVARRQRIEPLMLAWPVAQLAFVAAIVINERTTQGDLALLLFPMIGAASGFPSRVVVVCALYTGGLMIAAGLLADPDGIRASPPALLIPLGLLAATTILTAAIRKSSVEHREAAVVDGVTGLLNRVALTARIAELERRTGAQAPIGVLVIDIDHFKAINDSAGHSAGDLVLRGLSDLLARTLADEEAIYRLGGEEFLVLLPGTDAERCRQRGERLRATVAAEPVVGFDITVSVGAAASDAGTPFVYDEVFRLADGALYDAKRAGRDRVVVSEQPAS